jgi:hypothetical protein
LDFQKRAEIFPKNPRCGTVCLRTGKNAHAENVLIKFAHAFFEQKKYLIF